MYTLWHKDYGVFKTDNHTQVDRKLSMGFSFLDEIAINHVDSDQAVETEIKKRGRPKKVERNGTNGQDAYY